MRMTDNDKTADKPKKREIIPDKHPMPEQDPNERITNFNEVALGWDEETAVAEAQRCLMCKKATCVPGCPVEIDIPAFVQLVIERKFIEAADKIKETNALPAVCGRVCPQETQCERTCVMAKKFDPVGIGRLERFVADYAMAHEQGFVSKEEAARKYTDPSLKGYDLKGKKVAVVGSGPAGLTVAGDLAKVNAKVTLFEALHKPGGVLMYGIPEFRLPKAIVQREIDFVKSLGVELYCNVIIGRTMTIQELFDDGYEAIFVGTGAGLPSFMRIPGENLNGIFSANEYLTRANLMKAYDFPQHITPMKVGKKVAVLGAGNTAMDGCRVSLRMGADEVHLVYRRSRAEMPARAEEIDRAQEEGVIFDLLTTPIEYLGDDNGWVRAMICQKMELGEPDSSGRRRPVPIEGSEYEMPIDTVVIAIGQAPNPIIAQTTPGLEVTKWGTMVVNSKTMRSSIPGVYGGGDIVSGGTTVIEAMGQGKIAARAMARQLAGEEVPGPGEDEDGEET
jgi:glutamate synthase (NADPH/NADH) small chain